MIPECHSVEVPRTPANRVQDSMLLDAARECVLATGIRRTTLSEVARRAGVSRMTLYRRFPDVTTLLAALMTREFGTLLTEVAAQANASFTTLSALNESFGAPSGVNDSFSASSGVNESFGASGGARGRLVACAVEGVRMLSANPLLRNVLEVDPQLLLPYVFERMGSTQRIAEQFLHAQVLAGHADGSVRVGEPGAQVRMLMLIVQGVVLSLRPATADLEAEALFAELAHTLNATLTPEARS